VAGVADPHFLIWGGYDPSVRRLRGGPAQPARGLYFAETRCGSGWVAADRAR
jgi:hypothetical protein